MDGTWDVEVRKVFTKEKLRKINRHINLNLSKKEADNIAKRLLQDYVSGKEK